MSTLLAYVDTNDGFLSSSGLNYSNANTGSAATADTTSTTFWIGQNFSNSIYRVNQSFIQHNHTVIPEQTVVSAYLRMVVDNNTGSNFTRDLEFQDYNWGGTLEAADWRSGSQLNSGVTANRTNMFIGAQNLNSSSVMLLGNVQLQTGSFDVANSPRRYVGYSSKQRTSSAPTGSEITQIRSADYAGTDFDPVNISGRAMTSLIDLSMGAQVQLADGTVAYATQDAVAPTAGIVRLWRWNGSTHTELGNFTMTTRRTGLQNVGLCRDTDDNIYVAVSNNVTTTNDRISIRALVKSGSSWTLSANQTFNLPVYSGAINQVALAWHPQGTGGTLLCLTSSNPGFNTGPAARWALINAQTVRAGSGIQVRSTGDAEGTLLNRDNTGFANAYPNETGTLLDLCAIPGTSRGFVNTTTKTNSIGQLGRTSLCRYDISALGSTIVYANNIDNSSGFSVKNGDAKSRLISINESEFVTANVSLSTGFGLVIKYRRNNGNSTDFPTLADVRLHSEGITSLPTEQSMSGSSNWDIVHSPLDNRIWAYYFDVNDGRRLLRTDVSLTTGLAGLNVVEVATNVGASGSENVHLRVHRGTSTSDRVLITVGNRSSGGTQSIIFIDDLLNAAPNAPILTTKVNYDASVAGLFEWTFSDPNVGDTQTAFQMQIYRVSDDALIVDTNKVTSSNEFFSVSGGSLVNNEGYRWRVRTWDNDDEVGPYSEFSNFNTSSTGIVNITFPSVDNDPNIITAAFTMTWTVTNTTQTQYRVWIYSTLDESLVSDTGWLVSTATSHQISGLNSDVEYRIELRIRNSGLVESNTATVLVTPSYNRPEIPTVVVEPFASQGFIRISVNNPEPQGDRPNPTSNEVYRRELGTSSSYLVGTIPPNSSINDFEAGSRTRYEYWARAGVE